LNACKISSASEKIDELADYGNKYITEKEPWSKDLDEKESERIINNLSYLLRIVSEEYIPIIPVSAQKGRDALKSREKIILFPKI
jgi:methionyl-tRNA synthetase